MQTGKKSLTEILFWAILAAYLLYAAVYIYRTSFITAGERYFVLFDDAMISMRYARNLADGYGPVWNPGGERVEGYTNPLWVVFMALFHLLPLPASKVSLAVQISGALFLAANLVFVRRLARLVSGSETAALFAVILTAFYTPLNNWGLQGMEVSLLTLIVTGAVWYALHNLRQERLAPGLYLLLAAGTLVRVDMAVPALAIVGFLFLADPPRRWRHLAWGLGSLAVFLLAQTAFRYFYYGELLPNTYYLKMSGYPLIPRLLHGAYVFWQFVWHANWLLFLLPLTLLLFRRDREVFLPLLVFLGQAAYSIYVGGDAWEHRGGANRYLALAMPLYFTLFAAAVQALTGLFLDSLRSADPRRNHRLQVLFTAGAALFVLAAMLNFNSLLGDRRSLERWALLRQPLFIEGNKEYVRIALDLQEITTPDATIAVVTAGAIPYFSERPAIDLLGKNDAVIARVKPRSTGSPFDLEKFRPGHNKWDYDYSIGQLKPDVVVQLWGETDEAQGYIDQYYAGGGADDELFYSLRKDSPRILWDQVVPMP